MFSLYKFNLQTYCNMGRVEEFEEAILERPEHYKHNETLSRKIVVGKPILTYPQETKDDASGIFVRHPTADTGSKL